MDLSESSRWQLRRPTIQLVEVHEKRVIGRFIREVAIMRLHGNINGVGLITDFLLR